MKEKPQIRQVVYLDMKFITKAFDELTTFELYSIIQLRMDVFVVEQTCYYQDCDGKDLHSFHHWMENDNGEIIAYVRICEPGVSYQEPSIGRVVVPEAFRGKGYGRSMMLSSIRFCKENFSVGTIRISAQQYLEQFYNSLGFKSTGKEYLEDGIPHLEMVLNE